MVDQIDDVSLACHLIGGELGKGDQGQGDLAGASVSLGAGGVQPMDPDGSVAGLHCHQQDPGGGSRPIQAGEGPQALCPGTSEEH